MAIYLIFGACILLILFWMLASLPARMEKERVGAALTFDIVISILVICLSSTGVYMYRKRQIQSIEDFAETGLQKKLQIAQQEEQKAKEEAEALRKRVEELMEHAVSDTEANQMKETSVGGQVQP